MTKKAKPAPKLTWKQNLQEYWPLMLIGVILGGFLLGVAIWSLIGIMQAQGTLLIFGGDVVSSTADNVTFTNLIIEQEDYFHLNADQSATLALLEPYRTGNTYTLNLGWYNSHVFTGEHYGVSVYYRHGAFDIQAQDFAVTHGSGSSNAIPQTNPMQ